MLLRKTTWFWKSGLAAISFVLILSISGCSDAPPEENTVSETVIDVQAKLATTSSTGGLILALIRADCIHALKAGITSIVTGPL